MRRGTLLLLLAAVLVAAPAAVHHPGGHVSWHAGWGWGGYWGGPYWGPNWGPYWGGYWGYPGPYAWPVGIAGVAGEVAVDSDGATVIEWAERAEAEVPDEKLNVYIADVSENSRELGFFAEGERYEGLLAGFRKSIAEDKYISVKE